jgi:uncharacterized protein YjiS (DUF1127 family)
MMKQLKAAMDRANRRARHRREYRSLLRLDQRMLKDIGLERDEVHARLFRSSVT